MHITVNLPPSVQNIVNGENTVSIDGTTVNECLDNLIIRLPQLKPVLMDKNNKLKASFGIFVNDRHLHSDEMENNVHNGDRISIIYNIVGG
jgi:molybdopterin converting factor small subunit